MAEGFLFQCAGCGVENEVPAPAVKGRNRCAKCGALLVASNCLPKEVSDATFKAEAGGPVPVVAYLWSPACGICASYTLSVKRMAAQFCGTARIIMLNVEENPATPKALGIKGVPSVFIFKDGREVRALGGPQGARGIAEILAGL